MKKRNWIIVGVMAAAIGATGITYASGHGDRERCEHKSEHHGGMKYMMKELDLTTEQRNTLRKIKSENRQQMEDSRDQMKEIRKQLREQGRSKNYDPVAVRELADKKARLMSDMLVKRMESMQEIRKQLTAEQLEEFDEMKAHRLFHRDR